MQHVTVPAPDGKNVWSFSVDGGKLVASTDDALYVWPTEDLQQDAATAPARVPMPIATSRAWVRVDGDTGVEVRDGRISLLDRQARPVREVPETWGRRPAAVWEDRRLMHAGQASIVLSVEDPPVNSWQSWDGGLEGDMADGVVYSDDPSIVGAVRGFDLRTRRTSLTMLDPACGRFNVQVSGRWMLACGKIWDLQGQLAPRDVQTSGYGVLGDGVLVSAPAFQCPSELQALDLTDPTSTWVALGSVCAWGVPEVAVAERGPLVSVAWRDAHDSQLRLASFDVPASSPPPPPSGPTTAPVSPDGVIVHGRKDAIDVAWNPPAGPEPVYHLLRAYRGTSPIVPFQLMGSAVVPAGRTTGRITVPPAQSEYRVTVTAVNGAGATVSAPTPIVNTALGPPLVYADQTYGTHRYTVHWLTNLDPDTTRWTVALDGAVVAADLPFQQRSLPISVPKGPHVVSVTGRNGPFTGESGKTAINSPGQDTTAPTVTSTSAVAVTLGAATFSWKATDNREVASYDVRFRNAPAGKALSGWVYPVAWQKQTASSRSATLSAGETGCFSVRAKDHSGNVSAWSTQRCTVRPLDDKSLTTAGAWTTVASGSYYSGSARRATAAGATLQRTAVRADAAWLIANRCPTCGTVGVYDDGALIATLNLASSTVQDRALVAVPFGGRQRTGTFTVKVLSSGKPVVIDGMALRSH